jgi:hypothetical protein
MVIKITAFWYEVLVKCNKFLLVTDQAQSINGWLHGLPIKFNCVSFNFTELLCRMKHSIYQFEFIKLTNEYFWEK